MNLLLRTMLFATVTAGAVVGDEAYQRPREAAGASAAVAQVNGDPAAPQNLERLRQHEAWADAATGGTILFAALACFATWRPPPVTKVVDRRSPPLPKESV